MGQQHEQNTNNESKNRSKERTKVVRKKKNK